MDELKEVCFQGLICLIIPAFVVFCIISVILRSEISNSQYDSLYQYKEFITHELDDNYVSRYELRGLEIKRLKEHKESCIKSVLQSENENN